MLQRDLHHSVIKGRAKVVHGFAEDMDAIRTVVDAARGPNDVPLCGSRVAAQRRRPQRQMDLARIH